MPEFFSTVLLVFIFCLSVATTIMVFREDRRGFVLAFGICGAIAVAVAMFNDVQQLKSHRSLLSAFGLRVGTAEEATTAAREELKRDLADVKAEIAKVNETESTITAELAAINIDALRSRFPIRKNAAEASGKVRTIAGTLRWDAHLGLAIGSDSNGQQRVSIAYRDLPDPFIRPSDPQQQIKTYAVSTVFGLSKQIGDQYELHFVSKRVPAGPDLFVNKPTNFPPSSHISVTLDGESPQSASQDFALLPGWK
jgi:hypothetical protein